MAKIGLNPNFMANCAYAYLSKSTTYFKNNGHKLSQNYDIHSFLFIQNEN